MFFGRTKQATVKMIADLESALKIEYDSEKKYVSVLIIEVFKL